MDRNTLVENYLRAKCSGILRPPELSQLTIRIGNKVKNREAFFVGILRATQKWWSANEGLFLNNPTGIQPGAYKTKINTNILRSLYDLLVENKIDSLHFSPSVSDAICDIPWKQSLKAFEAFAEREHDYQSFYAKQELLVNLLYNEQPPPVPNGTKRTQNLDTSYDGPDRPENMNITNLEDIGNNFLNANKQPSNTWADKISQGSRHRINGSGWNNTDQGELMTYESFGGRQSDSFEFSNGDGRIKVVDVTTISEEEAKRRLPMMLNAYILSKCNANEHCRRSDFDGTAREALQRISFLQALQAIEHFATSVSSRIQKRPAYLMGILRGQEGHWDKSRAAAQLEGGSAQLLALPNRVLLQIAQLCLEGNCLPSDFTPEVCLALHQLNTQLSLKALHAFNSNKRIVAGNRGGVLNRPRFFQRLIQNVAEQNASLINSSSTNGSDDVYYDQKSISLDNGNLEAQNSSATNVGGRNQAYGNSSSMKRSASLSLSLDDDSKTEAQTSPGQNAWNSPLSTSNIQGNTSWAVNAPNPGGHTQRSMSIDNSHFQNWDPEANDNPYKGSSHSHESQSIPPLSPQGRENRSGVIGTSSCPSTPREDRENKPVGSPLLTVQQGWDSPMTRHSSSPATSEMLSQTFNGTVLDWNNQRTQNLQSGNVIPRSGSISESNDPWKQNGSEIEFGINGKPFSSLFSTTPVQQRPNTPSSQASSNSPHNSQKQKQLQPQDEEPDTLSETSNSGTLDLNHLRNLLPDERAEILEVEVIKLNKQVRAQAKTESKLLGELLQAKTRIRNLESQCARLSKDHQNLTTVMQQELMLSMSQAIERISQRVRANVGIPTDPDSKAQSHKHSHYS